MLFCGLRNYPCGFRFVGGNIIWLDVFKFSSFFAVGKMSILPVVLLFNITA